VTASWPVTDQKAGAGPGVPAVRGGRRSPGRPGLGATLLLGTLGVVFGDIGTSPLYAMQAVFGAGHGVVHPTPATVFGVVSLVFWSILLVVSVKYVLVILRADNDGEGGVMALAALARQALGGRTRRTTGARTGSGACSAR
jgi:KUP system potassium uptake protein